MYTFNVSAVLTLHTSISTSKKLQARCDAVSQWWLQLHRMNITCNEANKGKNARFNIRQGKGEIKTRGWEGRGYRRGCLKRQAVPLTLRCWPRPREGVGKTYHEDVGGEHC